MSMRMNSTASAVFLLIAVFVGGLLTGMLVERAILAGPAVAEAAEPRAGTPARAAEDRARLVRELELTPEQEARIDVILDEQQHRIRELMKDTRPRTREILKETRARVEEVLTPEQQARWEALHAERHRDRDRDRDRGRDRDADGETSKQ
jgi:Spy/CpxP family protein refolding chaperone